jgi:anaerobic magnesium-protoporphyrin IX monomethyl ester cyclase
MTHKTHITILNPPSLTGEAFVREGRCEQRVSSFQYNMIPVSLFSIAGVLKNEGFPLAVIDAIACPLSLEELFEKLDATKPQLLIMNMSSGTFSNDIDIIKKVKERFPQCHLAAIGNHASALPQETLEESLLDSIVIGEPEAVITELAHAIENINDFSTIQALAYKENNSIKINPRTSFESHLDDMPFPARELAPNDKYYMPIINEPYTLIITTRGCPYNCIYCTAKQYYGKKVRERSPDNIIAEIREIVEKQKVKNITMWSDTFTYRREFVMEVCQKIIDSKLDINWWCNSRVDKVDKEMLTLMKKSGCQGISYGVESGVQEILDNVKKSIKTEDIQKAFALTNEVGIECLAHVIFGLPGETKQTAEQTINFVIKLKPTYAQFYCAIPFPGTELYSMAKESGWLTTDDWNKYEINQAIIETKQLSADELLEIKKRAFKKFYLRPRYMFAQLKRIKSPKDFLEKAKQAMNFFKSWVS